MDAVRSMLLPGLRSGTPASGGADEAAAAGAAAQPTIPPRSPVTATTATNTQDTAPPVVIEHYRNGKRIGNVNEID